MDNEKLNKTFESSNNDMYKNYIASLFSNTIGTIEPKIIINNKQIENEWNKIAKENNLLAINYCLINELSKNGTCCLFFTTFFKTPKIVVAKMNNIDYDSRGEIKNLDISFNLPKNNILNYNVIISEKNRYSFEYCVSNNSSETQNPIQHTQLFDKYPITIFANNPCCKNDLSNVASEWIIDFNKHLDLLITDGLIAKGLFHLNTPLSQANSSNINALKNALKQPSEFIFENNNIFSLLQSGGLQIQQGLSNYQSIIDKLKYLDNKIKELSFAPRNTLDAGTKNIHSAEANSINSQSDDYIEIKANLLEISWKDFIINVFFDYLKNNIDQYKNFNFEEVEVEIEISGSTKYLQNQQNKYLQTQQGTLINPNEINSDQKEIKQEIKQEE